ncbi:hypothetical protein C0993_012676, partial [Termitomyces sp. T159_Od127]
VFPDISTRPELRAYHTSEIPLVFGTMPAPTSAEVALSKFVQRAWVAFARDPKQGLLNLGWPGYSPFTPTLALIGGSINPTGLSFTFTSLVDSQCGLTSTLLSTISDLEAQLGL